MAAQGSKKNGGGVSSVREAVTSNPAAERLLSEAETFLRNRALDVVDSIGDRITDVTGRLEDFASNGGVAKKAAKSVAKGDSPLKAGAKALGSSVKDKIGDLVGGGGGNSSGPVKSTLIAESVDVGVPVSVAYNQWTQFQEFGRFTKGVQSVNQEDETTTNWKAKIAFSTRSWTANITEQIPDERIAWTSDGNKGSVDGVVTFHELAPNLTRVLLELEYHPKGLFEKTGNLWRAQGRRARLDLKHFRAFVMMRGEETGAWRGEVRDGEVTESSDDGEQGQQRRRRRPDDDGGRQERSNRRERPRSERPRSERSRPERSQQRRERPTRPDREREERRGRRATRERGRRAGSAEDAGGDTEKTEADTSSRSSGSSGSAGRKRTAARASAPAKKTSRARAPRKTSESSSSGSGNGSGGSSGGSGDDTTSGGKTTSARKTSTSPRKKTTGAKKATAKKTPARKKTAPARKTAARKTATTTSTARKSTPRKSSGSKSTSSRKSTSRARKSTSSK